MIARKPMYQNTTNVYSTLTVQIFTWLHWCLNTYQWSSEKYPILNQSHAGWKPVRAWFLEFALVHACIAMCVSVCVCLSVPEGIINQWCDIDCVWLVKEVYGFSAFQLLYMALTIDKMDEHGLSNTAHCECLPRRLR